MKKGKIVPKKNKAKVKIDPKRLKKKRHHIEQLANSIRGLRNKVTRDINGDDEKERLTALVIAVMSLTSERIGNAFSESAGHLGVTGFQKKNIEIDGNTVYFKYIGKSGVSHQKQFSDASVAKALKDTIKNSPTKHVFVTSDGFRIRPDRVNRYLEDYGVTAKDLRSFNANHFIITKLEKQEVNDEEKHRQKAFNSAARCAAIKIGHGYATLKTHYMMPELEIEYVQNANIINLMTFYSEGGKT